jgi:thioredoxin reductase (NADPH)
MLDYWPYALLLIGVFYFYLTRSRRVEKRSIAIKTAAIEAGLTEPSSLHPEINASVCLGCATCVAACPEGNVIGIIGGKAELVEPTHCIGHGVQNRLPHQCNYLGFWNG